MLGTDLLARSSPPSAQPIEFCCPLCKGPLRSTDDAYRCEPCGKTFPVLLGIPDFRVFPDPYIDIEADRRKALVIAERYDQTDYRGLIRFYWSITPDVPPDLVDRYVRHAEAGFDRGRHLLESNETSGAGEGATADRRCLDLGCQTGGMLAAAAERFGLAVGIDIALRWLVVAKKRMEELGSAAPLVCCCAEFLPFRAEQFDLVIANNVIEHTSLQEDLLREAHRVLRPGGDLLGTTVNRFSLALEPHVRVFGVGWLPARWREPFVQRVRGYPYRNVHLLSCAGLRGLARRTAFSRCRFALPSYSAGERRRLSRRDSQLVALYQALKSWPLARLLLLLLGPSFVFIAARGPRAPLSTKS